jgi:diacylglycerol O-acyltransferase / wax synthase
MRQLSGTDNVFLRLERGNQHMHVAGLGIYDPSTAPGGKVRFKDVLRFFESRLDALPVFRRRLVSVPLELDRPYWIEDPNIDVEFHVRHIALPQPGDWRQLCIQVARIHSRPLDRSKPLWEAYVIEGLDHIDGLPPGSFALYIKFHHCAVDGEAGTEILSAIHSLTAEDFSEPQGSATRYLDREPSTVELCARALAHNVTRVPQLARFSAETVARLATLGAGSLADLTKVLEAAAVPRAAQIAQALRKPPATRFAGKVSAHRVVEVVGLPLAGFKALRAQLPDATINDLFMTTVGGALRQYLESKGELPEQTLTCMLPMSFRGPDKKADVGNQIGMAVVPLHTEIHDPIDRLHAIRRGAGKAKATAGALGRDLAARLFEVLPDAASEMLARRLMLPQMSIVVSNVRGPDAPLFMAGARLVNFAPVSIAIDGLGLNVTGFSYNGMLWLCAVACREMMPDPGFFAECLRGNFAALEAAAQRAATHNEPAAPAASAAEIVRKPQAARSRRSPRRRQKRMATP